MQEVIQEFTIGFYDSSGVFSIYMKQDDTNRTIVFHIVDNAEDYTEFLSNPHLVMSLREQLPNGDFLPDIPIDKRDLDLNTLSLTIHVTKEMLQQSGVANCELMFSSTEDGLIITTVPFKLIIEQSFMATPDEGTQEDFHTWTELYIEVRALEDDVSADELVRVSNENERISQENTRMAQEAQRQVAEAERERIVGEQVQQAEAWAKGTRGGVPVSSSDETYNNNAAHYSIVSQEYSAVSGSFMRIAGERAADAEAYAVGKRNGVDVSSEDETYQNNAKHYCEQSERIMSELNEMLNVPVTGVKGNQEESYRRGNINLTPANIGAVATNGATTNTTVAYTTKDAAKTTTEKTNSTTDQPSTVEKLTSGETLATMFGKISAMFKNVRRLWNTVGTTAIPSGLGDTVTGAITTLGNAPVKVVNFECIFSPPISTEGGRFDKRTFTVPTYSGYTLIGIVGAYAELNSGLVINKWYQINDTQINISAGYATTVFTTGDSDTIIVALLYIKTALL